MIDTLLKIMKEGTKMLGKIRKVEFWVSALAVLLMLIPIKSFDFGPRTLYGVLAAALLCALVITATMERSHLINGNSNTLFSGLSAINYVSTTTLLTLHFCRVGWPYLETGNLVILTLFLITWPIVDFINFLIGIGEKYGSRTRVIEREIFHQ